MGIEADPSRRMIYARHIKRDCAKSFDNVDEEPQSPRHVLSMIKIHEVVLLLFTQLWIISLAAPPRGHGIGPTQISALNYTTFTTVAARPLFE